MDSILVVADDSEIQDIFHAYLRNEGYFVVEVTDGLEALDLVKSISFELVILDDRMLRTDSIQACIKIWELFNTPMILIKDLVLDKTKYSVILKDPLTQEQENKLFGLI
ncbi:response regulator [Paenibacillus sp. BT-177]|uniref:response regulator n=1 Tax=Paenibacillus sp. BT-177 TaxID=2986930 RepID=UPI0021F74DFE|nr:response regulator [Paenibacillus sp. BT-177]